MGMLSGMAAFWKRQKLNFKVLIARDSLMMFSGRRIFGRTRTVIGYESIFLSRLGANSIQIGLVNGAMSLLNVLFAVPAGTIIDRVKNIKKLYLLSFALGLPNLLLLALAPNWYVFLIIMLWQTLVLTIQMPAKTIIDIDAISDEDRVVGLSIHRMITAIAGVGSPLILAYIINYYGGLDLANAIRPVFLLQFASEIVIFIVLYTKLENVFIEKKVGRESLVEGLKLILTGPVPLKLLLVRDVVTTFVMGMCNPFQGIYQVDVKMATVFIFGWIGVAEPAIDILLSIPAGKLIERYGRRKVGYAGHIAGIIARLLLVLTPRSFPELLILMTALGSLEGCLYLGFDAYGQEIIPQDIRGKWMGVLAVITGVIGVVAPVIGGFIWNLNPNYLFWLNVIQWTFIALPIMIILIEKYSVDGRIKSSI